MLFDPDPTELLNSVGPGANKWSNLKRNAKKLFTKHEIRLLFHIDKKTKFNPIIEFDQAFIRAKPQRNHQHNSYTPTWARHSSSRYKRLQVQLTHTHVQAITRPSPKPPYEQTKQQSLNYLSELKQTRGTPGKNEKGAGHIQKGSAELKASAQAASTNYAVAPLRTPAGAASVPGVDAVRSGFSRTTSLLLSVGCEARGQRGSRPKEEEEGFGARGRRRVCFIYVKNCAICTSVLEIPCISAKCRVLTRPHR